MIKLVYILSFKRCIKKNIAILLFYLVSITQCSSNLFALKALSIRQLELKIIIDLLHFFWIKMIGKINIWWSIFHFNSFLTIFLDCFGFCQYYQPNLFTLLSLKHFLIWSMQIKFKFYIFLWISNKWIAIRSKNIYFVKLRFGVFEFI